MNKLLAEAVRFLNGFIALLFVLVGAIGGRAGVAAATGGSADGGMILGAILGFIAAVLVCGVLATFIEIRNELVAIRSALQRNDAGGSGPR
jgi:hypothetical protein